MIKNVLMIFALACTGLCANAEHVTVLSTNDTHSAILPNMAGKGGLMRQKVVVDSIRHADKNVVLVNAGDIVQGTVFFSMFRGDVEYAALDSLGYDICILGNHEFDNGVDEIAAHYKNVKAAKVSSNYDLSETSLEGLFRPYKIMHFGGKKIAFMGINIRPDGLIADKCFGKVIYHDAVKVALELSKYLKETHLADYVVMVSHIGHVGRAGSATDVEIVKQSRYIDLVIGGHSHTLVDPSNMHPHSPHLVKNLDGREIPICQNGGQGEQIGKIDFDTETGKAVFSLIPINSSYDERAAKNYPAMNAWLAPYVEQVEKKMNTQIATSVMAMSGKTPSLGNWVCDVVVEIGKQLYGKEVEFSLMNRGGIRQPMPLGKVTEGDIEAMLPFDNRLEVIKIKGEHLMSVFDSLALRGGDAVSKAVEVIFDKDGKILSAKINGKKVKADKYYTLVTIDYLANGGSRMGDLKKGEILLADEKPYGQHVIEYVKQLGAKGEKIVSDDVSRMRFVVEE